VFPAFSGETLDSLPEQIEHQALICMSCKFIKQFLDLTALETRRERNEILQT